MYGPVDLEIMDGQIRAIHEPGREVNSGAVVIDLQGHYVLPGFIDCHAHIGSEQQIPDVQYAYDLWLAHGVTTVRELGSLGHGLEFTLEQSRRAAAGEIDAPDIHAYARFPSASALFDTHDVVDWLEQMRSAGVHGVKFFGDGPADLHQTAITHCRALDLRTAFHHSPISTSSMNALVTSNWGLTSIEHGYGLAEAMFPPGRLQSFLPGHNDSDERSRFIEAGRAWAQTASPGSSIWNEAIDALVESKVTMVPTFSVYIGARDAHRVQDRRWNSSHACKELMAFWDPTQGQHGSFLRHWGTREEQIWRVAIDKWMALVAEFALRGGRVAVGADSGYAYSLYGFSFIEEMELLVESGLTPEEVVRSATRGGAELMGIEDVVGTIEVGKRADLVISREDPLTNFKALYGSGSSRFDCDGAPSQQSSIVFTMKNGTLYEVSALLRRARSLARLR